MGVGGTCVGCVCGCAEYWLCCKGPWKLCCAGGGRKKAAVFSAV
jgi:hypothetical protein